MSNKHIAKAHDHFFRKMMSDKEVACTFFEAHLPKDLLACAQRREYAVNLAT